MKKVFFIAVNYNNSKYTLRYIKSVNKLALSDKIDEIIIVDNASELNDFLKIKCTIQNIKNVKLIRNKENVGYFKAINIGISSASREKNSLFVISNNDIEFNEDFLVEIAKTNYCDETFVIAPNLVTTDGYHQNPQLVIRQSKSKRVILKIYFLNYFLARMLRFFTKVIKKIKGRKDNINCYKEMFIRQGNGACFILTNNFFRYYEKLDERLFLWGEECLLSNQVSSADGKILYKPNIVVYHKTSLEDTLFRNLDSKKKYKISQASYKIYSKYF